MSAVSLQVIRDVLGTDLTPEAVVAASRDAETIKRRLRTAYLERVHLDRPQLPLKPVGEIRPMIGNIQPVIERFATAEHVLDSLQFPLLYGHSAAAMDVLDAQLDGTDDYDLASVLHIYAATAPLLDADILIMVDRTVALAADHAASTLVGSNTTRALEPLADVMMAMMADLPEDVRKYSGWVDLHQPEISVLQRWMWFIALAGEQPVDLFPQAFADEIAVQALLTAAAGPPVVYTDRVFLTLCSTQTPHLQGLTAKDIVAVREDDAFGRWRAELTDALGDLRVMMDSGLTDLGRRRFEQRFADRARDLNRSVDSSATLRLARRSLRTFALSVAGAGSVAEIVGATTVRDAVVLSAGATSTELVALLGSLVQRWLGSNTTDAALAKHYGVFISER